MYKVTIHNSDGPQLYELFMRMTEANDYANRMRCIMAHIPGVFVKREKQPCA